MVQGDDVAYGGVHGELFLLEHVDYGVEVGGESVAGAEDVEFFLDKEASFVGYGFFGVTDVDDAAGEGDFFDSSAKGFGSADGFDDDVGTATVGESGELVVERVAGGIDDVGGAGFLGDGEFFVGEIDGDGSGSREMGGGDGAETDSAATEDGDFVCGGDSSAGCGVKTYGERLDETEFF